MANAVVTTANPVDLALWRYSTGRLLALRINRYSWWVHWRELADFFLPRRYRWLITPNMMTRGSPINQHILDSTGVLAARNLASGIMSGKSSPSRPWFKLKVGRLDSTQTSPASLWLAECERLMMLIFHESNFYNSIATFYYDLVIYGTATMLIYEDFENVINCYNPCAGEYYIDIDGRYRPTILYREFTKTVSATVDEFGYDSCSPAVRALYDLPDGSGRSREIIVAHSIEPNDDGNGPAFGFPSAFAFRECYWEWGGSTSPQNGPAAPPGFLRKRGYFEQPQVTVRWDLVSNDAYGRSPAMDALGDNKQLQQQNRRKSQAIDKMVNPPLVADIQLKNQPASLLPGGITYVSGYAATGKPGFASVYDTKFPVGDMKEDLDEVRKRIQRTFFNDLFQTASQFETRSNITAVEWDMRKSESMVMLGPALERVDNEGLKVVIERVFAIAVRANILPPPPQEIAGMAMDIEFISMLAIAQNAAQSASIERVFAIVGNLAALQPEVMDKVNFDFGIDNYSHLLNNNPRMMRSDEEVAMMREARAQQQQAMMQAELAKNLAPAAKVMSETPVGDGNALEAMGIG